MSKTKTVNGKDYRWDYKNKKWVQSHGASGGESLKRTVSSVAGHVKSLFSKKNKNTDKLKTNKPNVKSVGTTSFNVNTASGKAAYEKALKASKTNKSKTNKEKDKSTTKALYGERNKAEAKKRKLRPRPGSAGAKIQQKLKDAGHTQEGLDNLASRHQAWKKARKEGTLGDWERKYHPDRTPEYKNKKKKTNLKIKGSEKLGDGYNPKTKSTTKSKVSWESMYGNKNKKKKKKKQDLNFTTM